MELLLSLLSLSHDCLAAFEGNPQEQPAGETIPRSEKIRKLSPNSFTGYFCYNKTGYWNNSGKVRLK